MKFFTLILFTGLVLASCKTKEKPVTKEEATTFAESLENSISKREPEFFNTAFSADALIAEIEKRSAKGLSSADKRAFREAARTKINMGSQLITIMNESATYSLVKQYDTLNEQHLVFRLYDDGSLNYHDIKMVREKGKIKIGDMFVYTSGEYLSETLSVFFDQMTQESDKDAKLAATAIKEIKSLIQRNKSREALELLESLPSNIRSLKPMQIIRIQAAMNLDDDSIYVKAIDDFRSLYPDNAKMSLLLIDGFILHAEYDKALAAVNSLDSMINKDPLLDYYRARCYKLKEDKAAARVYLQRLQANMPSFVPGAIELVYDYCAAKEWSMAADLLKKTSRYKYFRKQYVDEITEMYPEISKYMQ